jgi:hypothetical protein
VRRLIIVVGLGMDQKIAKKRGLTNKITKKKRELTKK